MITTRSDVAAPEAADDVKHSGTVPSVGERGSRGSDGGYSMVETVLLLPVLVVFTLFVVQYALVWHARTVAESAARRGVQAARVYTATDSDGRRQVSAYLQAVDPDLLQAAHIEVTRTDTTVAVRIRARVLAVPGMPVTVRIDERSVGPVERFVSAGAP